MLYLNKLFPHLARDDKDYVEKCFVPMTVGHELILLQLQQNDLPMTSNLFVDWDDIPTSYKDLQVVMRHSPFIFVLLPGTNIEDTTESMISRFSELAVYDPLSEFFVDKHNPYNNDKGIKPTPDLLKFLTLYKNSFEDWRGFSIYCGVGAVIELRFGMQEHTHRGKASVHPVPHTQCKYKGDRETSLDLSMFLNFSEKRFDKDIPSLAVGGFVAVDINNYKAVTLQHRWTSRVVAPAISTGIGQVCMIINRPVDKDGEVLDKVSHTKFTVAEMDKMSAKALEQWSSKN